MADSRVGRGAVVAIAIAGAVAAIQAPWMPSVCPMRLLLHVPCPSCGLTRAARCLMQGDWSTATHMHPLWWLVFPFVLIVAASEARTYVRTGALGRSLENKSLATVGATLLAALVMVWVARGLGAMGGPAAV